MLEKLLSIFHENTLPRDEKDEQVKHKTIGYRKCLKAIAKPGNRIIEPGQKLWNKENLKGGCRVGLRLSSGLGTL